ncbi:CU044_2847 family protein [uncultured Actinomyces sp.]|uniref:CU044_2847 family protein n=1 Tax=uncultured Actinomyces sp. TaxID=249061 RepID=UPI00288A21E9|nr:CU044_2847 family protein [uncultured Actinomyces sp.]
MTGATTNIIPARIGQEDVLVEAVVVPGTEKLSSRSRAVDRVQTMLDGAQSVIRSFAEETAGTVARIRQTVGSPDEVSVAFGLSFATTGDIIIASSTASASITVTLTYKAAKGGGDDGAGGGGGDGAGGSAAGATAAGGAFSRNGETGG